jgi:hypothetical protein
VIIVLTDEALRFDGFDVDAEWRRLDRIAGVALAQANATFPAAWFVVSFDPLAVTVRPNGPVRFVENLWRFIDAPRLK